MKRWLIFLALTAAAGVSAMTGCGSEGSGGGTCNVTTPASCPATTPSYATDVAPILQKYCTSCHSPTGVQASEPFDTHAGVAAHADHMKAEVGGCEMPPAGSIAPTDAERETILAWLVCGAPDN